MTVAHGTWPREPGTVVLPDATSPTSVPSPFAVVVESAVIPVPLELEPHDHPLHELVWVRGGTMTVRLAERVITVPEGQGVWLPAHTVHSGRTTARAALFTAAFDPDRSPVRLNEAVTVEVTPVLAALLTHLEREDLAADARLRAEAVVFDVLGPARRQLALQVPRVERVGLIVEALIADPTDNRTLREWAEVVGVSERTVARLFRAHTGLSFVQWRQSLRVHQALALVGEGLEVQEISDRLGYSQPSTFIASFKRVMGTTPGAYAARVNG